MTGLEQLYGDSIAPFYCYLVSLKYKELMSYNKFITRVMLLISKIALHSNIHSNSVIFINNYP